MEKTIFFTVSNDLTYDQRMIRICTSLSNFGYKVKLIGRKLPDSKILSNHPFQQKRIFCFFKSGKAFYVEYNFRLFWFLLFSSFDAICAIDLDTLGPGFLVSKLKSKKLIYDAHEYFTEVPEVVTRPFVKKVWTILERTIVPKVKYAYTVCESIAELFIEKYNTPFQVIRNVPFKIINPKGSKITKPKIIIYQGALNDGRGLKESIEAMQWIENGILWIVGEGDLSQVLRTQTQDLGLQNKVIFKGYIKPKELKELTAQASIGLNLLENKGLSYYYSLANKAFDYIQSEVPAINMDFPEYQKLNTAFETSILLKKLEPDDIANAINELLSNQEVYERLKLNCREAAKVFIWEKEEKKLFQFYKQVFE